jgi:hypothetical protein
MTPVIFDALTFLILAFILFAVSTTGRHIMSTQAAIDTVVAQLTKARQEIVQARDELLAGIAEVQEQLDNTEAPEDVDLTALTAAAQSLDDIVPDAPEVGDDQPAEVEAPPADDDDDDTLVDQLS